jgi:prepilin-type N-terminal cleavage/methylation domain-containing protein
VKNRFNKHASNIIIHPYSLVEMLVVIAIIAILAAIGSGGYNVARRWLSQSSTEALLAKIKIAVESYKNDKGYYPLPHTAPGDPESAVPLFKLDTNAKDGSGLTGDEHKVRKNMNNFIDYAKIQDDQSFKYIFGGCNYYYVKDGWNAPLTANVTLLDGSTTDEFGAIKYRCPGLINKTSFDLYSAGHDRTFGTEDDIYVKF